MAVGEKSVGGQRRQPSRSKATDSRSDSARSTKPRVQRDSSRSGRVSAPQAMRYAAEQLEELLGRSPESVSAVQPTEDGWEAQVEVMELERIPETTSVMASYRVTLDQDGELMAYEQTRRYARGQIDRHA
ncbi:gas vesicle protein [Streptomyces sp. NBC_00841]|uniref:gas vesicle protein GvpO n=1 Tax=unclassified Streptomyces TaxID=2593676 RepID=UPI0022517E6B|nr:MULTISPECIES: gas vesicle protein [unclassified Streptomyces]MCX4530599.1 gas vesicle protein [Streptomyces sp. NBC_01669]WSA03648.1 gas vesicle protein [Streptomyces sp. NBC_00841]